MIKHDEKSKGPKGETDETIQVVLAADGAEKLRSGAVGGEQLCQVVVVLL